MSYADETDPDGRLNGPADLRQRVNRAFKESSMKLEAERLSRPRDFGTMRAIVEGHRMRMWEANAIYKGEYATRVELRTLELIDQQAKKKLDHRHPNGVTDRFNANDLRRQAERDVRHDHEKHLARLRRQREDDMRGFLKGVARKDEVRGKAKDGFSRAVDRRKGHERRTTDQARASPKQRTRKRD